jgi:hypothetical protein
VENLIDDKIALRAYQFWEERGRPWGTPDIDWFKAEQELAGVAHLSTLTKLAREVGSSIGRVVATLNDAERSAFE